LRQGFNFIVQSTSSDILLFSLLGISERFKDRDMESRVVSTVHDSIELVCPHDELSDALKIVREEMVDCHKIKQTFDIDFTIPFEIEVLVGKSFGEGIVETFNG